MIPLRRLILPLALSTALSFNLRATDEKPVSVLMLGGSGGSHRPAEMAGLLAPAMERAGIKITYAETMDSLTTASLAQYDAILIYKDDGELSPERETALYEFVEKGRGLVAVHCASHAFRNSPRYGALVGGRFASHKDAVYRARIIDAQHPAMRGVRSYEGWDETYVHNELKDDIRVLMAREEDGGYEPYGWVRRQGAGRVYYTALGHDDRAWGRAEFQKLIERAILWAAGRIADEPDEAPPEDYLKLPPPEPLSPEASMKTMHLPENFHVELFASEPDIVKPMAMTFDERGRAWIIESTNYPNDVKEAEQGEDQIKICEDTDGDGRADKFTVFAKGLNIPTSLIMGGGGLIVALAPHIMLFKDTNGDDVADERKILYTGFGRKDTHAVHSNFRQGFDGWIWGTVGYSGGDVVAAGVHHKFSAGLFRFRPDGSDFEMLTPTESNTWGLGFNEIGEVFISKANEAHHLQFVIPNRIYEGVRGWQGVGQAMIADHRNFHPVTKGVRQVDWFNGYTAAAGMSVYTEPHPAEYHNRATMVCEPTGHLVHLDFLKHEGSGYVARDGWNLMASSDPWSAPIEAVIGPDSAVWMLDWYNYIVRHNPTPAGFETGPGNAYVTPQRDREHGRIYRIVYGGPEKVKAPRTNLHDASASKLVETLKHENMFWRMTAQRLLAERGNQDVLPQLAEMTTGKETGGEGECPAAIHALWTMKTLGAFEKPGSKWMEALEDALTHPSAGVRCAALAVLPNTVEGANMILAQGRREDGLPVLSRKRPGFQLDLYWGSLRDPNPRVRLSGLLALAGMPGSPDAANEILILLRDSRNAKDRWISRAAIAAAARSDFDFISAALAAKPAPETDELVARVLAQVAEHYARGARRAPLGRLTRRLDAAAAPMIEALLTGLEAGWPEDDPPEIDPRTERLLASLMQRLRTEGKAKLASLIVRWKAGGELKVALALLEKSAATDLGESGLAVEKRLAAAELLIQISEADSSASGAVEKILGQITPRTEPEFAASLVKSLARSESPRVPAELTQRWPILTPPLRRDALALLMRRAAWTQGLLKAVEDGDVSPGDVPLDQKQQLMNYPDKLVAAYARRVFGKRIESSGEDREKVLARLLPLAKERGDAAHGREVFEKNCMVCHAFNGIGNKVGPELTGIAARERSDILTDILDPNRSVEDNYRPWIVETRKGEIATGRLVAESRTSVELLNAQAERIAYLREDMIEFRQSKLSLMPEGFEDLPPGDLPALLEFLTARGKYLPLMIGKAATVSSSRGMFNGLEAGVERLIFPQWGMQTAFGVPFNVIDPQDGLIRNAIVLFSPIGALSRNLPKSVMVPCNSRATTVHLLSGVSGWGHPIGREGSVSLIVRLHYAGGDTEDHELKNGIHFADYIRVVDVPESRLAFKLREQQIRYLTIYPARTEIIREIEFMKGPDETAPVVMAVTIEGPE